MTGIQPSALLEDELLYAAANAEARRASWSDIHELLALNVELTHGVLRAVIASSGGKPPEPLEVPRPEGSRRVEDEPIVMRPHEFGAAMARGGV